MISDDDNVNYWETRSKGALQALISSWKPFGPFKFVLRAFSIQAVSSKQARASTFRISLSSDSRCRKYNKSEAGSSHHCLFFKVKLADLLVKIDPNEQVGEILSF